MAGRHEDQSGPAVDKQRHRHRAEHHERRAQRQAQRQVQSRFNLLRVGRHARNERGRALPVELLVRQLLQMAEQRRTNIGRKARRRLRGEKLRGDGENKPRRAQPGHDGAHAQNV